MENHHLPTITRGYRFVPLDDELIEFLNLFLENNAKGEPFPARYPILEKELYGDKLPWELFAETDPWQCTKDRKKIIYAFCKLTSLGKRKSRTLSCGGVWDGKAKKTIITNSRNQIIGFKRSFTFKPKKGLLEPNGGKWIIHEFYVDRAEDVVLCEIITDNKDADVPASIVVNPDDHRKRKFVETIDSDGSNFMNKRQNCQEHGDDQQQVRVMPGSTADAFVLPDSQARVVANQCYSNPMLQDYGYNGTLVNNNYYLEMLQVTPTQSQQHQAFLDPFSVNNSEPCNSIWMQDQQMLMDYRIDDNYNLELPQLTPSQSLQPYSQFDNQEFKILFPGNNADPCNSTCTHDQQMLPDYGNNGALNGNNLYMAKGIPSQLQKLDVESDNQALEILFGANETGKEEEHLSSPTTVLRPDTAAHEELEDWNELDEELAKI